MTPSLNGLTFSSETLREAIDLEYTCFEFCDFKTVESEYKFRNSKFTGCIFDLSLTPLSCFESCSFAYCTFLSSEKITGTSASQIDLAFCNIILINERIEPSPDLEINEAFAVYQKILNNSIVSPFDVPPLLKKYSDEDPGGFSYWHYLLIHLLRNDNKTDDYWVKRNIFELYARKFIQEENKISSHYESLFIYFVSFITNNYVSQDIRSNYFENVLHPSDKHAPPLSIVKKIFEFLALPFTESKLYSLELMRFYYWNEMYNTAIDTGLVLQHIHASENSVRTKAIDLVLILNSEDLVYNNYNLKAPLILALQEGIKKSHGKVLNDLLKMVIDIGYESVFVEVKPLIASLSKDPNADTASTAMLVLETFAPKPPTLEHVPASIAELSACARIALATICIERALPAISGNKKMYTPVKKMIEELWAWQHAPKIKGNKDMSPEEAKKLPSYILYRTYTELLLHIPKKEQENSAVRGINVLHGFICWEMDSTEYLYNKNKPFVMDSDITNASDYWLLNGMERICKSLPDPVKEFDFQITCLNKLNATATVINFDYVGTPVSKSFFEELLIK